MVKVDGDSLVNHGSCSNNNADDARTLPRMTWAWFMVNVNELNQEKCVSLDSIFPTLNNEKAHNTFDDNTALRHPYNNIEMRVNDRDVAMVYMLGRYLYV